MTFSRKIFISVFLLTLLVGTTLIWGAYKYVETRAESDFISRYTLLTKVLADTLTRLDSSTETLMLNAAQVIVEKDKQRGLLTTLELRELQRSLGITHVFVINSEGNFIRSTNEDPASIPNLFSFSPYYRKLLTENVGVEATPIIIPHPEPKPFKFLSVPSFDRKRIIEVGMRVDFIANTLGEAIGSDKGVETMSLFSPDGTSFGSFSPKGVKFEGKKYQLPVSFDRPIHTSDSLKFYQQVIASHTHCRQCDISGTSKNGHYYYLLETSVSKSELLAIQSQARLVAIVLVVIVALLALILGRILSRRLVRDIEAAVSRVQKMKQRGTFGGRIALKSSDEVSFLTEEFDRLLDSLESSQSKLVEAEKLESKVELARIVAHNIRSPVLAIEMMLPGLDAVPLKMQTILKNAVREIKQLSEKLKSNSESMVSSSSSELETELVYLPVFVRDIISQKQIEFSASNIRIEFECVSLSRDLFVRANSLELKSVISNIINNAVEAIAESGRVILKLSGAGDDCCLSIADNGVGIPTEFLSKIGKEKISFKAASGRGLGLYHAFDSVKSWGGKMTLKSKLGIGTEIEILIPKYRTDSILQGLESTVTVTSNNDSSVWHLPPRVQR